MNNQRRKAIRKFIDQIQSLQEHIGIVLEEESDYRDNIPENLQNSERYYQSDEACVILENIIDVLDNTTVELEEVI